MGKTKARLVDSIMVRPEEILPVSLTEEDQKSGYAAHWRAPVWRLDQRNLNGRTYTTTLAKRIVAENIATGVCDGHTPDPEKEYGNYVAVAKNPAIENGLMYVDIYILDDDYASRLDKIRTLGVPIGVSSCGWGETDEYGVVDTDSYEIERYMDFVQHPAAEVYAEPQKESEKDGAGPAEAASENKDVHEEEQMGEQKGMAAEEMQAMKKEMEEMKAFIEAQKAAAIKDKEIIDKGTPAVHTNDESKAFVNRVIEAVSVGTSFAGTVPTEIASEIVRKRDLLAVIRGLSTVHQASGDYKITVEGQGVTVAYTAEGAAIADSTPDVSVLTLSSYKIAALVKASKEVLQDPAVNVQAYITDMIAKGISDFEENEFINGTGSSNNHITGILTTMSLVANKGQVITAANASALTWADVAKIDAVLGAYAPNATLVMGAETANAIRLLQDGGGHYIFPQNESLSNVLGHPVRISKYMPKIATGASVIVAGDFSYYHIADRAGMDLQVLTELYAANDQVGLKATERLDAACALPEAFCVVKMG